MSTQNTPLCAFCWPTLTVAEMIEENTLLPTCARCVGRNTKPTMPRFLWRELRIAAKKAFDLETYKFAHKSGEQNWMV